MKSSNEPAAPDQGLRDSIERLDAIDAHIAKQHRKYFNALARRVKWRRMLRNCWHKLARPFRKSA